MTLQEAKLLYAFNAWATNRIFDALALLPAEQCTRDMGASHGSIHGTLTHLVASEKKWLSYWVGRPDAAMLTGAEVSTTATLKTAWEETGFAIARWLGTLTDRKLQEPFTMTTAAGTTHTHTITQALQHLVDHGTYHRGQVVTLLRQLGVTPPSTGMIGFFRETAKLP
jgi:uncharacterized damage-inducible protein DinB